MYQDNPFDLLIKQLSTLPGLGKQSARRIALHLLMQKDDKLKPLVKSLRVIVKPYVLSLVLQTYGRLNDHAATKGFIMY